MSLTVEAMSLKNIKRERERDLNSGTQQPINDIKGIYTFAVKCRFVKGEYISLCSRDLCSGQ